MRTLNAAVAVIAVACMMAASGSAAEPRGPRISVEEPRFDFGTISEGAQPEHVFEIKNVGDEVLQIIRVQPT